MPTWVTPTTWSTGQLVTKQQFVDWNNSMAAAGDHTGWSTWNPELYHTSTAFGAEVGSDGAKRGRKLRVGRLAICTFDFQFGTTANGAQWMVLGSSVLPVIAPLPWAASTASDTVAAGWAYAYAAAPDNIHLLTPVLQSKTAVRFWGTRAGTSLQPPYATKSWPLPGISTGADFSIAGCRFSGILTYRTNT